MKIDFNDEQLALLKEVVGEYAEQCYEEMLEFKRIAVEADDKFVMDEYNALAESEEARFRQVKSLGEYIARYEELMRNV